MSGPEQEHLFHVDEQVLRTRWAQVYDAFPWGECARIFAEHGWVYGWGNAHVPGEEELRRTCAAHFESCLVSLGTKPEIWSASGRFIVVIRADGGIEIESEALSPSYRATVKRLDVMALTAPLCEICEERHAVLSRDDDLDLCRECRRALDEAEEQDAWAAGKREEGA